MLIAIVLPALAVPAIYFANQRYKRLVRKRARQDRENADARANDARFIRRL